MTFLRSLEAWIKEKKVLESWPFWDISGFLCFQMGKLKQRALEHQFFEPKDENHSRAGNQILSCRAIQVSSYKSILPTGTQKGIMKDMFLWVGWCLLLHRSHNLAFGCSAIWCSQKVAVNNESVARAYDFNIHCFLKISALRCRSFISF